MSRLSQAQFKITICMLVTGASINAEAQYFYVHCHTISRLQTCFHHSVTVCDRQRSGQPRSATPAEYLYIHPLHLRNIHSKRQTGQTVRNRLREINPVPTGQHCPAVRPVLRSHHRQARLQEYKAAHFAASTKMENRELERRL